MADAVEFQPEWASAPGDTISDILHERKLSLRDFATQMGLALDRAHELLTGRVTITPETAQLLEGVLGGSSGFWLARELQYREDLIRLESKREIHKDKDWLREIPLSDMVRFGWVKPFTNVGDQLSECLRFFSVSNVSEWREKYQTLLDVAAFRISRAVMIQPGAVVAWLRQGERQASSIIWKPWSAVSLRRALEQIRPLTWRKDPQLFLPELVNRCAECGVAIAIVRTPAGCPASGAT